MHRKRWNQEEKVMFKCCLDNVFWHSLSPSRPEGISLLESIGIRWLTKTKNAFLILICIEWCSSLDTTGWTQGKCMPDSPWLQRLWERPSLNQ
jgi:hypothetical protein